MRCTIRKVYAPIVAMILNTAVLPAVPVVVHTHPNGADGDGSQFNTISPLVKYPEVGIAAADVID